jgi:hypothetical protein
VGHQCGDFWRKLTRVDILHVMGLGMCVGALLWIIRRRLAPGEGPSSRSGGIIVSLVTPLVVTSTLWSPLPDPGRVLSASRAWPRDLHVCSHGRDSSSGGAFGIWLDKYTLRRG